MEFKSWLSDEKKYYLANLSAALGAGMMLILAPWIAVERTGQAFSSGLIMIVMTLPTLLGGPIIGNLIDKVDNKRLCFAMDIARFIIFFGLYFYLKSDAAIFYFYVVIFFLATFNAIFRSSAQALVKNVFGNGNLTKVNSTNLVFREVGYLTGTGLGGVMIASFSGAIVAFIIGILFLFSGFCYFILSSKTKDIQTNEYKNIAGVWGRQLIEIKEGFSYLKGHPQIIPLLLASGLISLELQICPMLLSPMCQLQLHVTAREFGFIEMSWAIGSIGIGILISKLLYDGHKYRIIILFELILIVGFVIAMLSKNWIQLLISYLLLGFFGQVVIIQSSKIQSICEGKYVGRVYGFYSFAFSMVSLLMFSTVSFLITILPVNLIYLVCALLVIGSICIIHTKRDKLFSE